MEPLTPPPCSNERKALKRSIPVITIDDDDENDNKEFSPAVKREKNEATAPSIEGETPTFDKEDGEIDDETSSSESLKDEIEDELHGFIAAEVSNASSNLTIDADVELKEDVFQDAMEEQSRNDAGRFDALNGSKAGNNNKSTEIIKAPNFQLEPTASGNKRLVIFASNDRTMCYKFYIIQGSFQCGGCRNSQSKSVRAKILKDENGEEFVQMVHQHLCHPVKYVPPIELHSHETIIAPNYELQVTHKGHHKLVIFVPTNPNLCYHYQELRKNYFTCCECQKTYKKYISAKFLKDQDGTEYIQANVLHLCKPVPYVANKWNIIKSPNFFVCQPNQRLAVFNLDHSAFCYRYKYNKAKKNYNCISCFNFHGKYDTAKVIKDENGEECLQANKNHLCEHFTYKISDVFDILKSPNFTLINNESDDSVSILRVYSSYVRSNGYNFTQMGNSYACSGCLSKGHYFMSKIFLDETGEEVVLVLKDQLHVCVPITCG